MAKKKAEKIDSDFDLDSSLDFDDFDFPDPFAKDDRKPAVKVASGVLSGFKDTARNTAFLKATLKDTLPSGYGQTIDLSDQITGSVRKMYDDSAREIRPVINEFKRVATKLIPKDSKLVPKAVKEMLQRWEDDRSSSSPELSKERQREAMLSSQMAEIFQAEAAQTSQNRAEDIGRDNLKAGMELSRHKDMFSVANASAMSLSRMEQFQSNIGLKYQKKALELQYRQLFATQDLLENAKKDAAKRDEWLCNIAKNTALPEYVKITEKENFKQIAKNKFIGGMTNGLFGKRNQLVEATLKNITDTVMYKVKEMAGLGSSLVGAAEMGRETLGGMSDQPGMDMHVMGGNMAGSAASQWGVGYLAKKAKERLGSSKIGQRLKVDARGHQLSNMHENLSRKVNDFRRDSKYWYGDSWKSGLLRTLQGFIPNLGPDTSIDRPGAKDMHQPYSFTRRTDKSINEIIPGYLARILREVQVLRTGDQATPLMDYDFDKGGFTTKKALQSSILKAIVPERNVRYTHERLDNIIDDMQKGGAALSPEARQALKAKLLKTSAAHQEGNEANLGKYQGYNDVDIKVRDEIVPMVKKYLANLSDEERTAFSRKYNNLSGDVANSSATIQNQVHLGQHQYLQAQGLLDKSGKNIDVNALLDHYLRADPGSAKPSGGQVSGLSPAPTGPAGPTLPNLILPNLGPQGTLGLPPGTAPALPPSTPLPAPPAAPATPAPAAPKQGAAMGIFGNALNGLFTPSVAPAASPTKINTGPALTSMLEAIANASSKQEAIAGNALLTKITELLKVTGAVTLGNLDTQAIGSGNLSLARFKKFNLENFTYGKFKEQIAKLDKKRDDIQKKGLKANLAHAGDYLKGVQAKVTASAGYSQIAAYGTTTLKTVHAAIPDAIKAQMQSAVEKGKAKAMDLYVKGEASPRLRAVKLQLGVYRDRITKHPIFNHQDIKGEVEDENANLVLTEEEIPSLTMLDVKKQVMEKVETGVKSIGDLANKYAPETMGVIRGKANQVIDYLDKKYLGAKGAVMDVYVKGEKSPRLQAVKLKLGHYKNRLTKVPLTGSDEITAEVEDELGNLVVSNDELLQLTHYNPVTNQYEAVKQASVLNTLVPARLKALRQEIAGKSTPEVLKLGYDKASAYLKTKRAAVRDVYVKGSADPRLIGVKLKEGAYHLAATGKAIFHQNDIIGEVKDAENQTKITAEEVQDAGTYDPETKSFTLLGLAGRGILGIGKALWYFQTKVAPKMVAFNFRMMGAALKWGAGVTLRALGFRRSEPKDVYVGREKEPRLYAVKLKAGNYSLRKSGMTIFHHEDITDEVMEGDIIRVSEDDRDNLRVYDSMLSVFNPLKLVKWVAKGVGAALWSFQSKVAPRLTKAAFWALGKLGKGVAKVARLFTTPINVYVKGEAHPALLARIMGAGGYFSSVTNNPVLRPCDIDGPVLDDKGEEVLTEDDLKTGLVDLSGKDIKVSMKAFIGKAFARIGKMFSLRVKLPTRKKPTLKQAVQQHKENAQQKTVELLEDIKAIFSDKFGGKKTAGDADGDGVRDGSYQDKLLKRRKEKEANKNTGDKAKLAGAAPAAAGAAEHKQSLLEMAAEAKTLLIGMGGFLAKGLKFAKLAAVTSAVGYGADAVAGKLGAGGNVIDKTQDDENWKRASGSEKFWSGLSRGIEKAGSFMFLDNLANSAKASRIKSETAYLKEKDAKAAKKPPSGLMKYLSQPLPIGAAMLGGDLLKKVFGKKATTLDKIRYVQYGFLKDDTDHLDAIFGLEDYLTGFIKETPAGITLDEKDCDLKKMVSGFGLDSQDEKHLELYFGWYQNRFKPVFLTHLTALKNGVGEKRLVGTTQLNQVSNLDDAGKRKYVEATRFTDGPYRYSKLPVLDTTLKASTADDVKAAIADALKDLPEGKAKEGAASAPSVKPGEVVSGGVFSTLVNKLGITALFSPPLIAPSTKLPGAIISATSTVSAATLSGADKVGALDAVRFKAYGLTSMDATKVKALQMLEEVVARTVRFDANKMATWEGSPVDLVGGMLGAFGLTETVGKEMQDWASWFKRRFLPVYMGYLSAYKVYTGKDEASAGSAMLKLSQQVEVANILAGTKGVWSEPVSPWPNYKLGCDSAVVKDNIALLQDSAKAVVLDDAKKTSNQPSSAAATASSYLKDVLNKASGGYFFSKTLADVKGAAPVSPDAEAKPQSGGTGVNAATADSASSASGAGQLSLAGGAIADGRSAMSYITLKNGATLNNVNPSLLKNFYGMAEEYGKLTGKKVSVNDGFRSYDEQAALFKANPHNAAAPGTSMHEFGLALDVDSKTLDDMDSKGLMRKYGFTRPVGGEPWHMEPAGIQGDLTKYKHNLSAAIEATDASVGRGGAGFGSIPGSSKLHRNTAMALSILGAKLAPNVDNKAKADSANGSGVPGIPGTAGVPAPAVGSAVAATASPSTGVAAANNVSLASANSDAETAPKSTGAGPLGGPGIGVTGSTGSLSGRAVDMPADPSVKIPDPTGSGAEGMRGVITAAAKMVGVNPDTMLKMAAIESGFNPSAKASTSSASGLFQFTKDTWAAMVQKYGKKYGFINGVTSPFDVKANAIMGAHYIKETTAYLANKTKRAIGATEAYIGHFMGAGGGTTFLNALDSNPGMLGAQLMPKSAAANQSIFYAGSRPRTLTEIYAVLDAKVRNKLSSFGIKSDSAAAPVAAGASTASVGGGVPSAAPSLPGQGAGNASGVAAAAQPAAKPTATSSTTDMTGSPLADAYGFKPAQAAAAERSSAQPSAMSKDLFATTEGLLGQSVDVQKKMLEVLNSLFGIVSQKLGTVPNTPSSPNAAAPYTVPTATVSMRRAQT